jgi:hypothetical protein
MYSHHSFVRDKPEALVQLSKITTKSRRRLVSDASGEPRSVSPPVWTSQAANTILHVSPGNCYPVTQSESDASSMGSKDRGKLDLLAFALEQEFATRP